jgi:membrane protein implicated in regulation of membrane protease activity
MSPVLLLVAVGWLYVVLMMSVAEAMAIDGTVLGALFTLLLYGLAPLALVLYLLATPGRRRRRRVAEAAEAAAAAAAKREAEEKASAAQPDGRGHAAGDPVAPVREEP